MPSWKRPFFDERARIETLYLAILTRKPTDEESSWIKGYLGERSDEEDRHEAFVKSYGPSSIVRSLCYVDEFCF